MRSEESFGVVPLSYKDGIWKVFLIQHRKGGYWGFPKGHAEAGESSQEAAFRELKEETNLQAIRLLQEQPFIEKYQFLIEGEPVHKQVLYFAAEVAGEVMLQQAEIANGMWVTISEAFQTMTHKEGKDILAAVVKLLL